MARKQFFGIKFPFETNGIEHFYVDANTNTKEMVRSELMHLVFTPKGQRIRMPEYGTDLIKYIFEQNDGTSWESVKNEISESITRWIRGINLRDIRVVKSEDENAEIFVRLDYSIQEGNKTINDSIVTKI